MYAVWRILIYENEYYQGLNINDHRDCDYDSGTPNKKKKYFAYNFFDIDRFSCLLHLWINDAIYH